MHFLEVFVGGKKLQVLDGLKNNHEFLDHLFDCHAGVFEIFHFEAPSFDIEEEVQQFLFVSDESLLGLILHQIFSNYMKTGELSFELSAGPTELKLEDFVVERNSVAIVLGYSHLH